MSLAVPLDEIFAHKTRFLTNHESWKPVELGEVCGILNGFPFKSSLFNKDKGFPVIRIRNLSKGATETFYDGEVPEEVIINDGDLLIGMDGIFRCYEWRGGKAGLNQRVCKIVPNEQVLDKKFLLFGINSYLKAIEDATSSVTVGHLSSRDILRIPFPMPPMDEQQQIVVKLESLLARVDVCQKRLTKIPILLKRFRQAVLAAACSGRLTKDWREKNPSGESVGETVEAICQRREAEAKNATQKEKLHQIFANFEENDSNELPENWRFVALNKLCASFDYGTSAKSQPSGKVPVLRMGNIQDGRIDWADLAYTSDTDEIQSYSLQPNTVLFNRTNSPELVGKTAMYRGERPAIFAGYLIRINQLQELDPEYLNLCLNTHYAREFCSRMKTDGVSQSNINARKLGAFEVPFCPLSEQKEIVRRVEALFALANQIEARCAKAKAHADNLTQSILAKAFRGELIPTEREKLEPSPIG